MSLLTDSLFWKTATVLTLPLIVGGILHMVVVKTDALSYLKIPLHQSWFGANKTWRGIIVMPLLTMLGVALAKLLEQVWQLSFLENYHWFTLGLILGIGYVIPELPNSYIKRRMGITPGQMSEHSPWLFSIIDQADSVIGCVVVYALLGIGEWSIWLFLIFFGTGVHLLLNLILWSLRLRKNPL